MARTPHPPPPPRGAFVARDVLLDASDPSVFERWCADRGNQTLEEFCTTEWVATRIVAPPPQTPFGGTAEVEPGMFVCLNAGERWIPRPVGPPNIEVVG